MLLILLGIVLGVCIVVVASLIGALYLYQKYGGLG